MEMLVYCQYKKKRGGRQHQDVSFWQEWEWLILSVFKIFMYLIFYVEVREIYNYICIYAHAYFYISLAT